MENQARFLSRGSRPSFLFGALVLNWFALWQSPALADYHLERITPVLNQPTYLTQAPGEPTNILCYTTRISSALSGLGSVNTMGNVWRYDFCAQSRFAGGGLSAELAGAGGRPEDDGGAGAVRRLISCGFSWP
jgi:hypothetical protein